MKYNTWKIKSEHGVIKDFKKFLQKISEIKEVIRIIPWRIARTQWWPGRIHVTHSYETDSGQKFMMKKWGTAQELFVTIPESKRDDVLDQIKQLVESL